RRRCLVHEQNCDLRMSGSPIHSPGEFTSPNSVRIEDTVRRRFHMVARITGLLAAVVLAQAANAEGEFQQSVGPLLAGQCGACHSEKLKTSGFSVASVESVIAGGAKHGKAVIGGHPEQSPLVRILKGELQPQMPFGK